MDPSGDVSGQRASNGTLTDVKTPRIGLVAVSVAFAAPGVASAAGPPTPLAFDGSPSLHRKPASVVYSGDGAAFLAGRGAAGHRPHFGKLRWTKWSRTEALAWGADWHNNCTPDCVDGTYFPYGANLKLYRPRMSGGRQVFTRMTVTYTGAHPPYPAYRHKSWTASLAHDQLGYFWRT